jgi:diaminopimelate decarboxylase
MTATIQQLDECLSIRNGVLFIEECPAAELARRFGTPLYLISEDQLRRNARRLTATFVDHWPGEVLLLPSIKANSALALRRILTEEGTGCDVFGPGELEAALRAATDPARISLNGPMKGEALIERAISEGVRITLDSRAELRRAAAAAARIGKRALVRVRIRPDLVGFDSPSEMSPDGKSIRDAVQRYKAGIPTEDLLAMTEDEISDSNLDLCGVHLHLGRHSADPALWTAAVTGLCQLLERLRSQWGGWTPREVDVGGGFPAPRDPFGRLLPQRSQAPDRAPASKAYAEAVCGPLAEGLTALGLNPAAVRLEVEPGRALYADAGIHLATVGNVKSQTEPVPLVWVETDSSDAYLPDVNLEFNRWTCLPALGADATSTITVDITGRTCALDVIVPDAELPEVEAGDLLAFLDTGAYQDAGATNFNALPRPGTALVNGDQAELIRRHETLDDVFARDLIPERLRAHSAANDDSGGPASGFDHVSVSCADLDRSLDFYRNLLGLELRARGEAENSSEFALSGIANPDVRWADLQLPHAQVLELIEYTRPRGTSSRHEPNDPGATHIALRVADADEVHTRLRAAGVRTRSEPMTIETPGAWYGARAFYAVDPDGVTVELIQPAGPSRE